MDDVKLSKFLSLILRHRPEKIGLVLDAAGWVGVEELLQACRAHDAPLTRERLEQIVRQSDKQRFAFDENHARIRASQGHSVRVELGYQSQRPPDLLYHGTAQKFLPSIRTQGLAKGNRHYVHLSADQTTAQKVGARRGPSVVLTIRSGDMHDAGFVFFLSANGVWLVDHVPRRLSRALDVPGRATEMSSAFFPFG